ncbi:PAS domain-containing sensor histidine kinase [Methanolobus profundi]|uniref:histidine kinase n=1 Tax=Methanolobus profundi TaxID=487685 RepID=A0A1I4PQL0_9EURY|nr:PAS domain-containing sensor histidine kinase [Methanolobus profundi]SFM29773.1 PAS domain S-box-containing protein [Methanolobus profundi]
MSNDDRFRDMVFSLPVGILSCNKEGNITFVNKFLLEMLGSPSKEKTKTINLFTFEPIKKAGLPDALEECMRTGMEVTVETPYKTIWGKNLYLKISSRPDRSENGEIIGCVVIFEDISKRKKAEKTLFKRSEIEHFIGEISATFIRMPTGEIDKGISDSLGPLGRITNSNIICIFQGYQPDEMTCTHEWNSNIDSKPGVSVLKDIVLRNTEWFNEKSETSSLINVKDLPVTDHEGTELDILTDSGTRSLMLIPMFGPGYKMGFICLNSLFVVEEFDTELIKLLNIIAEIFISGIERQKTEQLMTRNEEKYRRIFEEIHDIYYESDFEGVILTISPSVLQHMGYHETELVGRPTSVLYKDPKDRHAFLQTILKNGSVTHYELTLLKKDRSIAHVSVNAHLVYDNEGNPSMIAGIIRDITESKRVHKEIKEHRQLLSSTFSSIPDLLSVIDRDHRVVLSNWEGHEHLKGKEEMLNRPCYEVFMDRDTPCEQCIPFTVFSSGETITYQKHIEIDNTAREVRIIPIFDSEGNVSRIIEHIRDITEQKRTEEEIIEARIIAETANRIKSEFIANMSHELRTPLNSIIGFSDILIDGTFGDLNDKQLSYLSNVSNSGKHLLMLINDILDISKIEAGEMQFNVDTFVFLDVVREVVSVMGPQALRKAIKLRNNVTNGFEMTADRAKIKQILYNLISNAIKFTPDGGSVDLDAVIDGNMIMISVSDTGIGISTDDLDKLFHPFRQIDSFYNRQYEGTGLGLALVSKFVEMHNGTITVGSDPGKGSCFTITIPLIFSTA